MAGPGPGRAAWLARERMPDELVSARLLASERHFRCERPVALAGAPDQIYGLADGRAVLVETKRRPRPEVHDADIAQLSAYRLLLAGQRAFRDGDLAGYGYLRLVTARGVVYRRVALWDAGRVVALHRRYWALRPPGTLRAGAGVDETRAVEGNAERAAILRRLPVLPSRMSGELSLTHASDATDFVRQLLDGHLAGGYLATVEFIEEVGPRQAG